MRKYLVLIFSLSALAPIYSQKNGAKFHSREVIFQVRDTLIRANILTGDLNKKPDPDKNYFWYSKGIINSNIGGYGGKLFNGVYLSFLNNKLIESGQFFKGTKTGIWKTWYTSGRLRQICSWKEGYPNGKYTFFNESGLVEKNGFYRNNKFHPGLKLSVTKSEKKIPIFKRISLKKKVEKEDSTINPKKELPKSKNRISPVNKDNKE
jgi:hypothetical protein